MKEEGKTGEVVLDEVGMLMVASIRLDLQGLLVVFVDVCDCWIWCEEERILLFE